ncbi:hypothetical protein [Salininema proteolyticum]|uniref:Aminoglycoside phosphotransferase domain-containing protein n=1 Tax=Salininema proteolyticum TaxID=1607685 RepID=A0ABV8TYK8_9ACTN
MSEAVKAADDMERRAQYVREVREMLFPDRTGEEGPPSAGPPARDTAYIAVPNLKRPRVLIPAARPAAEGALRRYSWPATKSARLKRRAALWAVAARLDRLLLPDRVTLPSAGGIDAYLSEAIGHPVTSAIHIGPARANRKPILHLLDPEGHSVGFAKIGVNDLTRDLVEAERDNLERLARRRGRVQLVLPEVAHYGRWREFNVLVTTPVPAWTPPSDDSRTRRAAAMVELSHSFGTVTGPLAESDYYGRLRGRLEAVARSGEDGPALHAAAMEILPAWEREQFTLASWHGDWTPWNARHSEEHIYLWDLERFETDVPSGFDALHYRLQEDIVGGALSPTAALRRLFDTAHTLLVPFGVDPDHARGTALLYTIDLAARYLGDKAAEAGAALGALGSWLLPALIEQTNREHRRG